MSFSTRTTLLVLVAAGALGPPASAREPAHVVTRGFASPESSTNIFVDLTISATGYLSGGAGDIFLVSGNFTNGSTQNLLWSTPACELQFKGGTFHTFALAGIDIGPTYFGYFNNFSFGTLRLGSGQNLILSDGNVTPGAAIYVSTLVLEAGVAQIGSITGNGFFIYYDPTVAANAYLNAQTYPLAGGGAVQPVVARLSIVSTARLPNQHVVINGLGVPNRLNTIQASPDLIQPFAAIGSVMADSGGNFTFDDPNAGSFTQRFYRASFP